MTREEMQQQAVEAAIVALEQCGRTSLLMGTGSGKTKTTLDILKHFNPSKITWLTNSEQLRDITAPSEFLKWDMEYLMERTTFMCYQTAYKLEGVDLGFVIADEADYSLTDEYSKVYVNNNIDKLLMVTASIRDEQRALLDELAPTVFSFSTQEAQDAGILNKTRYVFVEYMLDTTKNVDMEVGGKKWKTSEQEQYDYLERQYTSALITYLSIKKRVDDWYAALFPSGDVRMLLSQKTAASRKLKWINNNRFSFLMKLKSSIFVTKKILNKIYYENDTNKALVFSTYTEELEKVCKYTYHSKNKGNKKEPNPNIDLLNKGDIRVLGVCQAINRGANLVGVNHAVLKDYDGSHVKGQQRIGRMCRLLAQDEATIWILRPYFMKKIKVKTGEDTFITEVRRTPTRAIAWSDKMLADFRLDDSNSSTINYLDL
jgi:superfamily II DNA or RNA helicase